MPSLLPSWQQGPFASVTTRTAESMDARQQHEEELDEEAARQERIRLDTYYLPDRRASGELHGIGYTTNSDINHNPNYPLEQSGLQQIELEDIPLDRSSAQNLATQPFNLSSNYLAADVEQPRDAAAAATPVSSLQNHKPPHGGQADAADASNHSSSNVLELLQPISESTGQKPLVLGFKDLSVWAPINPKKPNVAKRAWKQCTSGGKAVTNPKRQILHNISGEVRPGEVLALMGPSGSGKTSLLTVLGGRSAMKYKGHVFVNDEPYSKATRRRIGFVLQDDVLYESLTVQETLSYAALLRLPSSMSRPEKMARVDQVVTALGLTKSRETIIGGFFRRGISGGERKRVSIGHELLINPAIILLDEPTSGLDSTTAMHLLSLLQDLAAGGRSIATTIHQPSSRLYQKLDWLMLLAEGHTMYYGKADKVLDWFGQFGYHIPFGVSIADYILDISLGEAGYSSSGKTGSAAITELYTAYEEQFSGKANKHKHGFGFSYQQQQQQGGLPVSSAAAVNNAGPADGVLLSSDEYAQSSSSYDLAIQSGSSQVVEKETGATGSGSIGGVEGKHVSSSNSNSRHASKKPHHGGASYWDQLKVLTQRSGRVRRFEQMTGQHFFQLFAVAFITGLVWWQRGQDYYDGVQAASDVLGLLFFILLFPSMRALFRALFTFPNEYRMLMKERPSGMYNLSAYYIARTAADVPAEMINTVLFVVIAYWFGGLRHTAGAFFGLLFTLVLVTLVAESWGLLIGGVFMEPKTAQTVTTVVILAFLLVGGYYVRNIPVWIGWIKYLSFLYWGYNLVIKTQFSDVTFYSCAGGACKPVPLAQLSLTTSPTDPAWPDVLILLAMLLFLRLVIYYVLRRKTRVRQKNME